MVYPPGRVRLDSGVALELAMRHLCQGTGAKLTRILGLTRGRAAKQCQSSAVFTRSLFSLDPCLSPSQSFPLDIPQRP
jgi:hypothetical protein